jgi:hypothetical protein
VARLAVSLFASRRARIALVGAAGAGLVTVAAAIAFTPAGRTARRPRATAVSPVALRHPSIAPPAPEQRARGVGDPAALAYYRARDRSDAQHVDKIVWSGPMLRVYTDLPSSEADSKVAIALCQTAAAYLEDRGRTPMVFVHAGREAGYPVLANKMDTDDDCRLNRVP